MSRPLGFIPAEMDERAASGTLLECLKMAEACCKQLGYMRRQSGWLRMAAIFGATHDQCVDLLTRRRSTEVHDPALIGVKH